MVWRPVLALALPLVDELLISGMGDVWGPWDVWAGVPQAAVKALGGWAGQAAPSGEDTSGDTMLRWEVT